MGNAIVTRIIKTKDFTTMSNHCFKNKNLSYKAKGMLAAMLSFPDGWNFSVAGLAGLSTDGESSVKSALNELKSEGYVKVYAERDSHGQISKWHYDISEVPLVDGNPDVENPDVENPHVENQPPYKVLNNDSTDIIKNLFDEDSSSRIINNTSNNLSSTPKKEKKGLDLSFVSSEYIEAFGEWLNYKRKINDMYRTQRGVERAYRDLLEACNNNPEYALVVVNYSIDKEYKGIYAPKNRNYGNSSSTAQQPRNRFIEAAKAIKAAGGIL